MSPEYLARGQVGLHREIEETGRVSHAKPGAVVEDSESQFLWTPIGTPVMYARVLESDSPSGPRQWDKGWELTESIWRAEVISIMRPGRMGRIEIKWNSDGVFQGWKLSLISKGRRTHFGYDTYPFQLAVVIAPDGSWAYKNEDELEYAVEAGRFSRSHCEAIRAQGELLVKEVDAIASMDLDEWRQAVSDLPKPSLPINWEDRSMYSRQPRPDLWLSDLDEG